MVFEELSARLNDGGYKNWLKAGHCLLMVRDVLCHFVNNEMRSFHGSVINNNHLLRSGVRCDSNCRPKGNQFTSVCSVCHEWKVEILKHHTSSGGVVNWSNCKPGLWPCDHWELAKAYMPRGQASHTGPEQCDAAALLNLLHFCDRFSFLDQQNVREVIRQRNELMHSCEMRVSPQWMKKLQKNLDLLLWQLRHIPNAASASREIQKILSANWLVCLAASDDVDGSSWEWLKPELISQLEIDLLRERLVDLLTHTESEPAPDPKDIEELEKLTGFIKLHPDLEMTFHTLLYKDQLHQASGGSGE